MLARERMELREMEDMRRRGEGDVGDEGEGADVGERQCEEWEAGRFVERGEGMDGIEGLDGMDGSEGRAGRRIIAFGVGAVVVVAIDAWCQV
jgi:hypothetical protein